MQPFIRHTAISLLVCFFASSALAQEQAVDEKKPKTPADELSYALGMDVGRSLKRFGAEVELPTFMDAVKTTLQGGETLLTPQQANEVTKNFVLEKRKKRLEERKAAAAKNSVEGEAFLAENGKKEGVVTTDSGLQYQVIKEGTGPKPKATDEVTVQYRGTLLDGTEFDSSYKRGKPATFRVKGVIPGWTEALQLMPVGSTYKLFIPSKLAYGKRGSGARIGPNSTLIFEVELLGIADSKPKQAAEPTSAAPMEKKEAPQAASGK
jgi:FKBP-type peptidyl-prolyl cis-trans isomerase FkpA/FKBP-type peptidyl-prolyl cis-trans isomerase FklB